MNRMNPDEPMRHFSYLKRVIPHAAVPSLVLLVQVRPVHPPERLPPALVALVAERLPEVPGAPPSTWGSPRSLATR